MANFLSKAFFTQSFCIAEPTLTEKNLPDQSGRVHIITGGYAGVGQELAEILYAKGATVYIAGRNEDKASRSAERIRGRRPTATGRLAFLHVDLNDLSTIRDAVESFRSRESRLDVLVNNAGVMFPPRGSTTRQGHDLQFGTNCLGPFLFTKLLMPTIVETAKHSPSDSVRVLWAASSAVQVLSPPGGVVFGADGGPRLYDSQETNYGQTKVANILLAVKMQELFGSHGVVSVSFNPGNLKTELQRHLGSLFNRVIEATLLYPAIYGAYTELYSGWSQDVTAARGISYIMPWGRDGTHLVRPDIQEGIKGGLASRFWDWCEQETKGYESS